MENTFEKISKMDEASKKIAEEFIERYQKGLEETKVEPRTNKTDKQKKGSSKNSEKIKNDI